jgi:hypothetical protein
MSKEEKIIELRKDIKKLKELIDMMRGDMTSGSGGIFTGISTRSFLSINFDYTSTFMPSVLSYNFSEKLSTEIALPIILEKYNERKKELYSLEHSFWDKIIKRFNL